MRRRVGVASEDVDEAAAGEVQHPGPRLRMLEECCRRLHQRPLLGELGEPRRRAIVEMALRVRNQRAEPGSVEFAHGGIQ